MGQEENKQTTAEEAKCDSQTLACLHLAATTALQQAWPRAERRHQLTSWGDAHTYFFLSPHPFPIRQEEERFISQARHNNKVLFNNVFFCQLRLAKHFTVTN